MRRYLMCILLGLIGFGIAGAQAVFAGQSGRVVEGLQMESALLAEEVDYAIYLPPGYDDSDREYPVVYLLHGYTDEEWAWIQFGEVQLASDRAIADRTIPPMIIVMPDGGVTWYINDHNNDYPYEDMFIQEFIPFIEKTYRIRPQKEFRGISGLSMGGYGALMYSMRYHHLFAACAAFSAGVMTEEEVRNMPQQQYDRMFGRLFGAGLSGDARLTDHYKDHSPIHLAETMPADSLKQVRYYLDCGDDDFLYRGNSALHVVLRNREIPHEYRVRDGSHSWIYWRTGIVDGLAFIGRSFQR